MYYNNDEAHQRFEEDREKEQTNIEDTYEEDNE